MEYPRVDHSHIVTRHYLENFAIDGMIAMRLVGEATSKVISTKDAAVRKAFYSRERPEGGRIDDVEWSLSKLEDATAQVLRAAPAAWPLSLEDKAKLAELFAFQLIRGPRWKDWHEDFTRQFVADREDSGSISSAEARTVEQHLLTDTQRLSRMLSLGTKVTAVLGSMHWTRIDFASALVVTSDHPVVLWPIDGRARVPGPTPTNLGVLETLDVRVPISPRCAILMTWGDEPDDVASVVRGTRDHAANLNAFTIAQAEHQWFHEPGAKTPSVSGRLLPLSRQLLDGYGSVIAGSSRRRAATSANVQPLIGADLSNRDIGVVYMHERQLEST